MGETRVGRRAEQKRRWDRENRAVCRCGRHMGREALLCRACHREEEALRQLEKRRLIVALWHRGLSGPEIAEATDSRLPSLWVEINRMRKAGWDLPLRRAATR